MSDIGIIGLGVMGENLALNIESKGYKVSVFNRTYEKTEAFLSGKAKGRNIRGFKELQSFISSLNRPRSIILLVKAGKPVDDYIGLLKPLLEKGDTIIDFGNSHFSDSDRRYRELGGIGLRFVGAGVSGGEEGALKGPSIMAGGSAEAFGHLRELFEAIAAKVNGEPCVDYFGEGGAGHFVKMVHNGIEYGMMGAIAEVYDFLKTSAQMSTAEIGEVFDKWSSSELSSFLVEATARILQYRESPEESELVELIVDEAEQKGTGRWSSETAMELGAPAPCMSAAVISRTISALRDERLRASAVAGRQRSGNIGKEEAMRVSSSALYCSFLMCYSEGLDLLQTALKQLGYGFKVSQALRVWRAGSIIRSRIINEAYKLVNNMGSEAYLFLLEPFKTEITDRLKEWAKFVEMTVRFGVPSPVIASALNYYYSVTSPRLPANLIQALRDYFGAHQFKRIDREGTFHSYWGRQIY